MSGSLCALLWENPDLVFQETGGSQARYFPGRLSVVAHKLSRLGQTIQKAVVSPSRGLPISMQQVALALNRFVCHGVQQVTSLCHQYQTPWPGQWRHSACHGRIWMCMPSHQQPSWASGREVAGLPMQENHSDCSRVAEHALVLGSCGHVQPNPTESAKSARPSGSYSAIVHWIGCINTIKLQI